MGTPVNIGSTSYTVAGQGQRGWGPDTTALLLRLATVANQVVTSNYVLTSDTFFSDVSGTYGIKSNFLKGVGAIASADGFVRMGSPYANPGQGLGYPGGTPEGKSYTYISWRNSLNSADLHLFPNSDNVTLQFAGKAQVNIDAVQTLTNKVLGSTNQVDGAAINAGTITDAKISASAAIALSKLAALTVSRLLVSDASGVVTASSVTSTEASYLSGVTSAIQTQLNTKQASGSYITGLTGHVVATGPGSVASTIQAGVVTNAMIASAAAIAMNKLAAIAVSKALVTDSSGFITTATTTSAEINFLAGVTSAVQTQLNAKQALNANLTAISAITDAGYLGYAGGGSWFSVTAADLQTAILPTQTGNSGKVLSTNGTVPSWIVAGTGTVTPSSTDTFTNKSISGSTNTLSAIPITALSTFTSAQLATQLTDETGTGANVFANSPTLVTPALGTPSAAVLTNATGLPLTTGVTGTLGLTNGGTGQTTANAAFNALAPSQTSQTGKFLQTDGSNTSWVASSGGLAPVATTANVTLAVVNTMYSCTSTGGFTITLPAVPTLGGVIGVMDAGETCSATNFIRVTPATGQSIDGYVANDSLLLDYARANAVFYAAPGATSWKVQYQATSMIAPGFQTGYTGSAAIATGYIGEVLEVTQATATNVTTSNVYQDLGSLTLTPGVWVLSLLLGWNANGATSTQSYGGIGTASGASPTGLAFGLTQANNGGATAATNSSITIPNYYVKLTASQTFYAKVSASFTAGNPQYQGRFTAIRIA